MHEIQDERYYVNDEAIIDAFFLVLKEKELEKITVSDIIKKAGIVRSTFYNHYENIPVLIAAIEDKTIRDIFTLMENFKPRNDYEICKSYFGAICSYTRTNPFLANLLLTPRGDAFFEKAINMLHHYVKEVSRDNSSTPYGSEAFAYRIACAIGSTIGVLHKWVKEDFQVPESEIADILTQAFMSGILPFLSRETQ